MTFRLFLLATLLSLLAQSAPAQRTTRPKSRPRQLSNPEVVDPPLFLIPDTTDFQIAGFDKPLNSLRETFHFTNLSQHTITELFITINYTDTSLRQLHRQSRHIIRTIPPGETSLIIYPSFDRQNSFYYHLSRRPRVQATPFNITITVDSVRILPPDVKM
ncbi:MAG: hypothetical protein K2M07_03010 [Muribaculaceae bacterium]|nr:hypothetical protein [Muribaculaceae bacterium]